MEVWIFQDDSPLQRSHFQVPAVSFCGEHSKYYLENTNTSKKQTSSDPPIHWNLSQTQPNPKKTRYTTNSGQIMKFHQPKSPWKFRGPISLPPKSYLFWRFIQVMWGCELIDVGQGTSWSLKIWIPCFPNQRLPVPICQIHCARSRHYPPDDWKDTEKERKVKV